MCLQRNIFKTTVKAKRYMVILRKIIIEKFIFRLTYVHLSYFELGSIPNEISETLSPRWTTKNQI